MPPGGGGGIGSDATAAPNQPPIPQQTPPMPPGGGAPAPPQPGPPMQITPQTPPTPGAGPVSPNALPPPPPPGTPTSNPQAHGILGRALGLDPNQEASLRGTLGKGMTAAGNSAGKSPFQAAMSGAGAGVEGGKEATDKTQDQQNKFLSQQIAANNSQSQTSLRAAQAQQALAAAQDKMTGGKSSVMNSQQQLYLRAMGLVNNDPEVKLAKSTYDNTLKETGDPESAQSKAAQKAHADLVQAKVKAHLNALGLDPSLADKLGKMPGSTQDNPVPKEGLNQQKFDQLPAGAYFVNPKDGRVLIKSGAPQQSGGGQPPAGAQQQGGQAAPPQQGAPQQQALPTPPIPAGTQPRLDEQGNEKDNEED